MATTKPATPVLRSQAEIEAPAAFSLEQIADNSVRTRVAFQVARIHDSIRRTAMEVVEIGRALTDIRQAIPEMTFVSLCQTEFGMDQRVARRFIASARYVDEHMPNQIDAVRRLSPTVLYGLAQGDVSAQVVDQVLAAKKEGKPIMPADIREAMRRIEEQIEKKDDQLQQALTDLTATRTELEEAKKRGDQAELRAAKVLEQHDRLTRNLQRAQDETHMYSKESADLQQQIAQLKERLAHPAVVEKEVPTVPKGFTSLEEAIKANEKKLRESQNALAKAEERMAEAQRKLAAAEGAAANAEANADILSGFRADIQALCAKYPHALVATAAADDPRISVECDQIAGLLRGLADQITASKPAARKSIKAV